LALEEQDQNSIGDILLYMRSLPQGILVQGFCYHHSLLAGVGGWCGGGLLFTATRTGLSRNSTANGVGNGVEDGYAIAQSPCSDAAAALYAGTYHQVSLSLGSIRLLLMAKKLSELF